MTHPAAAGRPSSPSEARGFISGLTTAGAKLLGPSAGTAGRLMATAAKDHIAGARVFDLLIAMIALEHNASEIWSHDKVSLPCLAWRSSTRSTRPRG
ncbi:MAG: hypothetical protein ACC726_11625 [Chloroflexota bacterium]